MASFNVKFPVISERPPEMAPLDTPGAEYTISSSTMAILDASRKALPVMAYHVLAPCVFICIETAGLPIIS